MDTPHDWTHDQNLPDEAKGKTNFWMVFDSGAFERGEVKDPMLLEMYKSLMNEPFA